LGQDNVVGELGQGSGDVEMRDIPGVVIAEDVHMEDIGVHMEESLHQNHEISPTIIAEENEQLIEENQPTQQEGWDTKKEPSVEELMEEMREGSDTEIPSGDTVKELIVESSQSPEMEETPVEQIREVEIMIQIENVIEL